MFVKLVCISLGYCVVMKILQNRLRWLGAVLELENVLKFYLESRVFVFRKWKSS